MATMTVGLFGATGFVGRYIVRLLAEQGHQIIVAARRPKQTLHLKPAGEVGQIVPWRFTSLDDIAPIVERCDAVVSLAGILYESRNGDFDRIHRELPERIAKEAASLGITKLVHISAIGADSASKSLYAQSKAAGEAAIREHVPTSTILRPSIVFGPEDNFFNQFANMSRFAPFLPLIGGGKTRFQPVYVNDVARACVTALEESGYEGQTFELGGPDVMSFEDCLKYIIEKTGRKRPLISIPMGIARLKAAFLEKLPVPPLTRDQLLLLEQDNVVSADAKGLDAFGITPTSVEAIVPRYLKGLSVGQPLPAE